MPGHEHNADAAGAGPAPGRTNRVLLALVVVLAALALGLATILLIVLKSRDPVAGLQERLPGMDQAGDGAAAAESAALAAGRLVAGPGTAADLPGDWPQFRGARGDNVATNALSISTDWKQKPPVACWSVDLGEGYAGAAVRDGRVYLLDYDQAERADALRCLSLADGREIWRFSYPVKVKRNHGMSRTVPTLAGKYVVTFGPKCHVVCLEAETGKFVWGRDLVKEFNAEVPQWYAGQCPLVDGGRVILGTGGDALLVAVDLATGEVVWKSPNPRDWKMTHASVVPVEFAGRRMYVYCGSGGVAGVAAEDGKLLWETDAWVISIATVPTPVPVGGGRIFLSGGYNAGALMLQLAEKDGAIVPATVFRLKAADFGSTQQTPILHDNHLFGVRPDGQLACLDLEGRIVWTSGAAARFGLGPYVIAGGYVLAMNDDGLLTLAAASPDRYEMITQAKVLTGHDAWAPLAVAGNRLIARDLTRMVCLDLKGEKP